jgi:predicted alpha/beta superfamily hydrolase
MKTPLALLSGLILLGTLACGGTVETGDRVGSSTANVVAPASANLLVHYPTGWDHRITLRCGGPGYDWQTTLESTWTQGDVWTLQLDLSGDIACKPLFDDQTWAIGPNWSLSPGQTLDMWPHFFHDSGAVQQVASWHSNILNNDRGLWIYLPPSYDENPNERYPVVYMHDGQNLFDDSASFSGVSWNVQGAMDQGARDGSIHEAIVVGIDNTDARMGEYTPVADPDYGGGNADAYLRFVTDELKPQIDSNLRTFTDAPHTAMVGSSLGGLVSLYAGLTRPDVFSGIGALSPSTWWDNNWIITRSQQASGPLPARAYLDSGDSGDSNDDVTLTAQLAQVWQQQPNVSVDYLVQTGASHGEYYWRQRVPGTLGFLLGSR